MPSFLPRTAVLLSHLLVSAQCLLYKTGRPTRPTPAGAQVGIVLVEGHGAPNDFEPTILADGRTAAGLSFRIRGDRRGPVSFCVRYPWAGAGRKAEAFAQLLLTGYSTANGGLPGVLLVCFDDLVGGDIGDEPTDATDD